ncbi:cytoplasmic protein [Ephemerocybe angulata]|uniref:Cytoplasmic protein n=1 Tax=Ephemerocybe angulata TaxID=980116 RepID=A0A8H6MCF2_9AGAR|nr:cytoplasmic protein [Tulosesus angulatus]
MWEPLPLIVYGYAVHPLSPSRRETGYARNRLSTVTEASADEHTFSNVVNLEVGDEVYAFEKYTAAHGVEGEWYRGCVTVYVVCTTRRPPVTWSLSSDGSNPRPPVKSEEPQQVFIGIFPASHIYVRDELTDAEGRLPELARSLNGGSMTSSQGGASNGRNSPADLYSAWHRDKASVGMDTVREQDEDDYYGGRTSNFRLGPPPDQAHSSRAGLTVYSTSIRSRASSPAESQVMKPPPPRPSLKSGDDTMSGLEQPIIDEIASALREWHNLMFQYLARRDYPLFHIVKDQIEALHLGRRQLLVSALSAEETVNMRRDCVTKLVVGNLVQGLDVIVRHPTWGGLVTVDVDGNGDPRSWISAVRMYAMQVSLAYMEISREDIKLGNLRRSIDYLTNGSVPTPAHSAFPNLIQPHRKTLSQATVVGPSEPIKPTPTKFYHIFLDLRAFVASLCAPGETAELFFSLWTKHSCQFLTEDFCAILNHNGVLARDPSSRIRTLFTDLSVSDVQDPIYLVCRIVRNGALKIGSDASSGTPSNGKGTESISRSESFSPLATGNSYWADDTSPTSPHPGSRNFGEQFRRPFGCAVLELTDLAKMLAEQSDVSNLREHTIPIYVPTNETSFSMIHQNIINGHMKEFEKSSRAESLALSVKFFRGDLPTVVRENMTILQDIPHTLRLGFPDAVFPGETRNELYVKLWCGDFTASHSGSGRLSVASFARGTIGPTGSNVQITVEVRDSDGQTVPNVICQGSGEPPLTQFHSIVFQRCNEPTFGELLKLRLPSEGIPDWHLFFTFRNRASRSSTKASVDLSDKPYAFAFQPLFPDANTFVKDGSHTLLLYRADKLNTISAETYLASPCRLLQGQKVEQISVSGDMLRLAPPIRDTLTIRSSLCSTRFTHNPILLQLLGWERLEKDALFRLMTEFPFIGESEIVKYLRDIFDSLFGILISSGNQSGELDLLVFNALVTILLIVQDRRFSNFQPVLDVYIERHFSFGAASSHMIHSMNRLLSNPTSLDNAKPLRSALKVWHYIFKFIARSRELQKIKELGMGGGATAEHLESKFKRELRSHLSEVTRMMSTTSPASIIGTQTIALQHFTSILPELAKMFNTVELVSIVTTFANAITAVKGKIVIWKLIMYLHIVKGFLFDNAESRPLLVDAVVIWIKPHFGRYDEYAHTHTSDSDSVKDAAHVSWLEGVRLCVTIIAVMLDKLQQSLVSPVIVADRVALGKEQDNVDALLSLMPRLLDSYREVQSPGARRAIERTSSASTTKAPVPVTFPESYPFSLVTSMPEDRSFGPSTTPKEDTFYPTLGETAIVFLVLALSAQTRHIVGFFQEYFDIEGRERFITFLTQFFKVAVSILDNDAFPKTWLNANVLAHKVLVKIMDPVATILSNEFIPRDGSEYAFDAKLWKEAFHMLLKLLSSEHLVIEQFSPQKRRAIWRLAGDLRGEGASILLNLWQALAWTEHGVNEDGEEPSHGGYQVYLHPLVGHVVNLCLSHHDQLRSNAVTILFTMVVSQYYQDGHFDDIENEVVTKLDSLFMSDSKGDDISRAFFIGQLRLLFESTDVDDQLRQRVGHFLDSVDLFLELLLREEYADDRVIATLRLMNFIRRIGRDEIYIKYVHQLVNMHLQSQNYVEAALTLKLHADLHEWDLNAFVPPMEDLGLPQQSHFHRKETLCLLILDYLGKGKAWENAVDICRELAFQHSEVTFNYARLSEILRHQATLLEHIITEQRYYPDYYRVTVLWQLPSSYPRQAIRCTCLFFSEYRGYDWEKFGAFCERMLNKHPGAQLYKAAGEPPADIRYGNDQYIQCTAVTPEPNRELPIFTNPDVPLAVRTYYEHCGINLFSSTRQEEIWIEKTFYTTEEAFPTVLRRSEVVRSEIHELSPLENALQEVESKTKELTTLHAKYNALAKTTQVVSTNALAMSLNSAGIGSYRQVFFNPEYIERYPDRAESVDKLRSAIDEQVRVIDSCLRLHGLLCSPEFIPFHETLMKFFRKNFRDEIRRLAVDDGTGLAHLAGYGQPLARDTVRESSAGPAKQTPLQRHLAHLTKHGINAVASSPGEIPGNGVDSSPTESPHNSFVNVGNGSGSILHTQSGTSGSGAASSAATSTAGSYMGSIGSFGSLRGRFSRFGSLNFGRRNGGGNGSTS